MSEEEKKAYDNLIMLKYFTMEKEDKKSIEIILNLIEKQQKEIEEWQKGYIRENNYWLKFRNKINKIANNDKDCSDNAVIKAVKDLKDKNTSLQKEIKLMKSININDNYISKDKIKNKIKELEETMKQDEVDEFGIHSIGWSVLDYVVEQLKELLEENNKCK